MILSKLKTTSMTYNVGNLAHKYKYIHLCVHDPAAVKNAHLDDINKGYDYEQCIYTTEEACFIVSDALDVQIDSLHTEDKLALSKVLVGITSVVSLRRRRPLVVDEENPIVVFVEMKDGQLLKFDKKIV